MSMCAANPRPGGPNAFQDSPPDARAAPARRAHARGPRCECERATAAGAPEHRVRPHRRSRLEPRRLHAARAADGARRRDVHELLRDRLAVLPVPRVDLHRASTRTTPGSSPTAAADGGFAAFHARGEEQQTFATAPPARGYRTAMMGKYLNGYTPAARGRRAAVHPAGLERVGRRRQRLPEFNYNLNENGTRRPLRQPPRAIPHRRAARARAPRSSTGRRRGQPVPARDRDVRAARAVHAGAARRDDFPRPARRRGPGVQRGRHADKPPPGCRHPPLTAAQIARSTRRSASARSRSQAVDRMIGELRGDARAQRRRRNTYIVFSSDNGFHMGEHRLMPGKRRRSTPTSACR